MPGPPWSGVCCRQVHRQQDGDHEPEEDHDGIGVQPRDSARVETEAWRVSIAGVRARPGDHRAQHQDQRAECCHDPCQPTNFGAHQGNRDIVTLAHAIQQVCRQRDQDHRGQEVGGHDRRVETGQHGDPAQEYLQDDAEQRKHRDPTKRDPTGRPAPDRDDHQNCGDADDTGQGPVAELDELVESLLLFGHRGERSRDALGPGWAAQARAGQPHQPASDDDADLDDQVEQQDPA